MIGRKLKLALLIALVILVSGCGDPTLGEWVNRRGYYFNHNYSDRNLVGRVVDFDKIRTGDRIRYKNFRFSQNKFFDVSMTESSAGSEEFSTESIALISGSANLGHFLTASTKGTAAGSITSAAKVSLDIQSINLGELDEIFPKSAPRAGEEQRVCTVTEQIRIGDLSFRAYSKTGYLIKTAINVKQGPNGKIEASFNQSGKSKIRGSNLVVGFDFRCLNVLGVEQAKYYPIPRGQIVRLPSVRVLLVGTRITETGEWEAAVIFTPTAIQDVQPADTADNTIDNQQGSGPAETSATSVSQSELDAIFGSARRTADEIIVTRVTKAKTVVLRAPDLLSIPGRGTSPGTLIEVEKVESDHIVLVGQRVAIE